MIQKQFKNQLYMLYDDHEQSNRKAVPCTMTPGRTKYLRTYFTTDIMTHRANYELFLKDVKETSERTFHIRGLDLLLLTGQKRTCGKDGRAECPSPACYGAMNNNEYLA